MADAKASAVSYPERAMGGRGSSSGTSANGKAYGTEFSTVLQSGNIKFVVYNDADNAKTPMETMTKGRVYVTMGKNRSGDLIPKSITYYDKNNKRYKQTDLTGEKHKVGEEKIIPHTHKGYQHSEHGTTAPSQKEQKMIDRVLTIWKNRNR